MPVSRPCGARARRDTRQPLQYPRYKAAPGIATVSLVSRRQIQNCLPPMVPQCDSPVRRRLPDVQGYRTTEKPPAWAPWCFAGAVKVRACQRYASSLSAPGGVYLLNGQKISLWDLLFRSYVPPLCFRGFLLPQASSRQPSGGRNTSSLGTSPSSSTIRQRVSSPAFVVPSNGAFNVEDIVGADLRLCLKARRDAQQTNLRVCAGAGTSPFAHPACGSFLTHTKAAVLM